MLTAYTLYSPSPSVLQTNKNQPQIHLIHSPQPEMSVLRRRHRPFHHLAALLAAFILISAAAEMEAAGYFEPGQAGLDQVRRRLIGSSPPMCKWRCGKCRPCKAMRVTIHPGVSVPLDYYPEAWRCSCRGHLFMP